MFRSIGMGSGRARPLLAGSLALAVAASLAMAQNREPAGSAANVPTAAPAAAAASPGIAPRASGTGKPSERLRENTRLVDVTGTFASVGAENVLFSPGGGSKESFRVLENLALERVSRTLDENRGSRWIVSGTITEYHGSNYLLVTKAVSQSQEGEAAATP